MSRGSCDCEHDREDLIDDAFGLLEDGDIAGAAEAYEHAAKHGDSADLATLAGCIAAERGAFQDALAKFNHAVELDPTHVVALIDAAEIQLEALGDVEACLATCDRALSLAEDDPESRLEIHTFRARALMEGNRDDEARQALQATEGIEVADADALERVGGTAVAIGAWDIARRAFSAALRVDPDHADAHYGMGWVHFEAEENEDSIKHWVRVWELDSKAAPPPWRLTHEEFDALTEHAIAELPARARTLLESVAVVVEPAPAEEEVRDGLDPRVLGLFCGPAIDEQGVLDAPPQEPNVIKLYQRNLEAACGSREELEDEIRTTVLHETAHFFGLEEEALEELGLA